jgi:hypothetical protein
MKDLHPPAAVRAVNDLAELAHQINAEHAAGEQAAREGLEHFRAAGEALVKAKAQCGHGKWLPWLKKNIKCGDRQARRYMALAKLDVTSDLESQWQVLSGNVDADDTRPAYTHVEEATEPRPVEAYINVGDREPFRIFSDGPGGEVTSELVTPEVVEPGRQTPAPFDLVTEMQTISDWLTRRREKWPAKMQRRLPELLSNMAAHLKSDDTATEPTEAPDQKLQKNWPGLKHYAGILHVVGDQAKRAAKMPVAQRTALEVRELVATVRSIADQLENEMFPSK